MNDGWFTLPSLLACSDAAFSTAPRSFASAPPNGAMSVEFNFTRDQLAAVYRGGGWWSFAPGSSRLGES
jgi:hypothetical protein